MKLLKTLILTILMAVPGLSQAPQIPLSGTVGPGGLFAFRNADPIVITDANYSLSYPQTSAGFVKVTSSVSLTAQRDLIEPFLSNQQCFENLTTGSQAVRIIGTSGAGVVIANGTYACVQGDGTNYVGAASGGGSGEANVTGIRYGNGTGADTATTSTQIQNAIGGSIYAPASSALNGSATANTANGVIQAQSISGNCTIPPQIFGNSFSLYAFGAPVNNGWEPQMLSDCGAYGSAPSAIANDAQWDFAYGGAQAADTTWRMLMDANPGDVNAPAVFNINPCNNNVNYYPSDSVGCIQDTYPGMVWTGIPLSKKVVFGTNAQVTCAGSGSCTANTDFPNVTGMTATAGETVTWTASVGAQGVAYVAAESKPTSAGSGTFSVKQGSSTLTDTITGQTVQNPYIAAARWFIGQQETGCNTGAGYTITGYTSDGHNVTMTVTTSGGFAAGQNIIVSGMTGAGSYLNGLQNLASGTSTTFTFVAGGVATSGFVTSPGIAHNTVSCSAVGYRFAGLTTGQQTFSATVATGSVTFLFFAAPATPTNSTAASGPRVYTSTIPHQLNLNNDSTITGTYNPLLIAMFKQMNSDGLNVPWTDLTTALDVPNDYAVATASPAQVSSVQYSASGGIVTITTASGNNLAAGNILFVNDCSSATFLNGSASLGNWVTVLSSGLSSTQFQFAFPAAPAIGTTADNTCHFIAQATTNPQCPGSNNSGHGNVCWQNHMKIAIEGMLNAPLPFQNPTYKSLTVTGNTNLSNTYIVAPTNTVALNMSWADGVGIIYSEVNGDPGNLHAQINGSLITNGGAAYYYNPVTMTNGQMIQSQILGTTYPSGTYPSIGGANVNSGPIQGTSYVYVSVANITNCSISGGVGTFLANNTYTVGQVVLFANLTACSFLNYAGTYAITSASATQFSVGGISHANLSSADSGQSGILTQASMAWVVSPQAQNNTSTLPVIMDLTTCSTCSPASGARVPNLILSSSTAHGVLVGEAGANATSITPSTSGYVLTSNGPGADPTFAPVSGGGIRATISVPAMTEGTCSQFTATLPGLTSTMAITTSAQSNPSSGTSGTGATSGFYATPYFSATNTVGLWACANQANSNAVTMNILAQ